jgi:hypothetical protein
MESTNEGVVLRLIEVSINHICMYLKYFFMFLFADTATAGEQENSEQICQQNLSTVP